MPNAIMLPLVRKIDSPEEYPFSRAKIQVGGDWLIVIDRNGVLLKPVPLRHDSRDGSVDIAIDYRCDQCNTIFLAYDHEGYIHECCEVN